MLRPSATHKRLSGQRTRSRTIIVHLINLTEHNSVSNSDKMDHIITTLGVDFFETSARKAVMKRAHPEKACAPPPMSRLSHRDSLICLKNKFRLSLNDDDTMSTLSVGSSDSSLGISSVTFAEPLVTATHYRPRTTLDEKAKLFYRDAEYREFRHEYIYGRRQRKRVNFSASLVSDVWAYEAQGDKSSLYYEQCDFQRYVLNLFNRSDVGKHAPMERWLMLFVLLQIS